MVSRCCKAGTGDHKHNMDHRMVFLRQRST